MASTFASITTFIQSAFSPLITVFKAIMVFLHMNVTGGSWGLAIIGLTIVVRAALIPLTVKQFSSMAKLQVLGPEIKALQARYKDDKPRLNEEMMKFYRENQVNPFGSCLPLVLQFPVFISLFYMLRSDLKLQICGHALKNHGIVATAAIQKASCQSVAPGSGKFLFIPDVTDSAHGLVLAVLIVLYVGSQLIASLLTTATVDRNQRLIALGLPFVFTIFIIQFPSGLILYWITTNLWTVGQQYIVRRYFPPPNMPAASAGSTSGSLGLSKLWSRGSPAEDGTPKKVTAVRAETAAARAGGRAAAKPKAGKGAVKAAVAEKDLPSGKASAPAATARRKGTRSGAPANTGDANGSSVPADAAPKAASARPAKQPSPPRPRGSAPPPPPRKKKKRSGRRR